MTKSSFYVGGDAYEEAVAEDNTTIPSNTEGQTAPSSMYPNGTVYEALHDSDDVLAQMTALKNQTVQNAANAAASDQSAAAHDASAGVHNASAAAYDASAGVHDASAASSATASNASAVSSASSAAASLTSADNSQTSETNAAASASTSTTQAGIATTQAGISTTQAGISTTQAGIATAKANAASTSETNAAASASTSTTQAGIATTKASQASTSETNAASSASTATTQAGIATTKASQASTSETNAAAYDASASSSASRASASATKASDASAAAVAKMLQFQGIYYGPLTADPTVDPNGAAPDAGDFYYNTALSPPRFRDFSGTVWQDMVGGSGGVTDADYLVKTANSGLSAERVVTNTTTITWDWTVAGQAKANVQGLAPIATSGSASDLSTGITATARLGSGTADSTSFLRGDQTWANPAPFASGTKLLFVQTSAPTGWTKQTTHNDKTLRVVSGTASSGGTNPFSTVMAQTAVGNTTLSTTQMPSHSHTAPGQGQGAFMDVNVSGGSNQFYANATPITGSAGGGGAHNHSITMAIQYVDVIIAIKD